MTGKTHIAGGLLGAALCCTDISSGVLLIAGSILPDIDHGSSLLGKNIPLVHKFFKHRGFTHSLLFCYLMYLINPYLAIGVAIHIILDLLTKDGVHLLSPIPMKINFFPIAMFVKTGGFFEKIVCILCYVLAVGVFVNLMLHNPLDLPYIRI